MSLLNKTNGEIVEVDETSKDVIPSKWFSFLESRGSIEQINSLVQTWHSIAIWLFFQKRYNKWSYKLIVDRMLRMRRVQNYFQRPRFDQIGENKRMRPHWSEIALKPTKMRLQTIWRRNWNLIHDIGCGSWFNDQEYKREDTVDKLPRSFIVTCPKINGFLKLLA